MLLAAYVVFNPPECARDGVSPRRRKHALIAQLAEHALSKRKVTSSNLVGGCTLSLFFVFTVCLFVCVVCAAIRKILKTKIVTDTQQKDNLEGKRNK